MKYGLSHADNGFHPFVVTGADAIPRIGETVKVDGEKSFTVVSVEHTADRVQTSQDLIEVRVR
jgi:hypothetical protein